MKIFSILFLVSFALFSQLAWSSSEETTSVGPIEKAEKDLDKINVKFQNPLRDVNINLESYTRLLSTFSEFKKYDVNFTTGLLNKVKNQDTLSGAELFELRRTITTYYKINKKILDFSKVYDFGGFKMSKTFAGEDRNMPLIKAHLIWLSGHLLVLDHLEKMHDILYESDSVFRRIVKNALLDKNNTSEGVGKTLNDLIKMNKYTVEIGESLKFSQQITLVRAIETDLKSILSTEQATLSLVDAIVHNDTSTEIAQGRKEFKIKNFTFVDSIVGAFDTVTGWLSGLFGNIAGSIQWRKGYLYKNETALGIAREQLQPMDVLLEKSPFVLTDKFIPGHYGHAAIYLGTKDQLEAIGMWNHPDIIPYQDEIASGKVILEAVRSGVRLNTVEEFFNIDEFTIMRKSDALTNESLLIDEIMRGMDQIGKEYDFNFDISTLDKIVCSELVYIFYGTVHWPTQYRLGRATITPDDVAEIMFQKNTKFHLINFMVSKEEHRIELVNLGYVADEMDYELRKSDGNPIEDQKDPNNSYWKKETKCFNVTDSSSPMDNEDRYRDNNFKRVCKTSYKEFYYEEKDAI